MSQIDKDKIAVPNIQITEMARKELCDLKKQDFTLKERVPRILISGKKCEGFTYGFSFTKALEDDFTIKVSEDIFLHLDPFISFYMQNGVLDYIPSGVEEGGFIITNLDQELFEGKFWKEKMSLVPPQKN